MLALCAARGLSLTCILSRYTLGGVYHYGIPLLLESGCLVNINGWVNRNGMPISLYPSISYFCNKLRMSLIVAYRNMKLCIHENGISYNIHL